MKQLWAPWRMQYVTEVDHPKGCFLCAAVEDSPADPDSLVVYAGPHAFCILNRFPYNNGHLLVAPKAHKGRLCELSDGETIALHRLVDRALHVIEDVMQPQGFNIGLNLGRAAGAGLPEHLHWHIVPRWSGDTNFMPVIGEIKIIPQALMETRDQLRAGFARIGAEPPEPGQSP
jgi:ATP adenylyltransferase